MNSDAQFCTDMEGRDTKSQNQNFKKKISQNNGRSTNSQKHEMQNLEFTARGQLKRGVQLTLKRDYGSKPRCILHVIND